MEARVEGGPALRHGPADSRSQEAADREGPPRAPLARRAHADVAGLSGRLAHGRAELLAKRPHGRLRRLSAELENVGEASDFLADFLARRAHGRVPAAFWKNPENIWLNLAKIQQKSGKFCEILEKNSKQFSNF